MTRQVEFAGKSGAVYRYRTFEEDRFLPPQGANYVIARITPDGPDIVFAGETESLSSRCWSVQLDEARFKYGDQAEMLARLNVSGCVRAAEQEDLLQEHRPAMNYPRLKNAA